jgi:hypothetical protein
VAPAASADPPPPRSPPSAPRRVRVTAPPTASARATVRPARGAAGRDLDEHTVLGDVYLRGLLREQRRLAGGVLALLGLALGPLPVLFALFPGLASVRVAGLELPWLVLGAAVYPLFIAVGWWYVRGAERTERDFTVLLSDREPGGRETGP